MASPAGSNTLRPYPSSCITGLEPDCQFELAGADQEPIRPLPDDDVVEYAPNPFQMRDLPARTRKLAEGGRLSLLLALAQHRIAWTTGTNVGRYYGSHSPTADLPPEQRLVMHETNCIQYAMQHLKAAYECAGMSRRWQQIERRVANANRSKKYQYRATDLAKELQKDGWTALYFNPDMKRAYDRSIRGHRDHDDSVKIVNAGQPYYGLRIDDEIVDYRPEHDTGTVRAMSGVEQLRQVPFFFGFAKAGIHTFVGHDGIVSDAHYAKGHEQPDVIDRHNLEKFVWWSGIIMVPPGTWSKDRRQ